MTDERWIVVVEWERYQHRDTARSKVPPWVKNETKLLSSPDYLSLSEHRALLLHRLWLEYARSLRRLPLDTRYLTRRLNVRVTTADLEALNHAGFIQFSASKPASNDASKPAGVDRDRDREVLTKTQSSASARATGTPERLDPQATIAASLRTMIRNGAIRDDIDLDAELEAAGLNGTHADELRAELHADEQGAWDARLAEEPEHDAAR